MIPCRPGSVEPNAAHFLLPVFFWSVSRGGNEFLWFPRVTSVVRWHVNGGRVKNGYARFFVILSSVVCFGFRAIARNLLILQWRVFFEIFFFILYTTLYDVAPSLTRVITRAPADPTSVKQTLTDSMWERRPPTRMQDTRLKRSAPQQQHTLSAAKYIIGT